MFDGLDTNSSYNVINCTSAATIYFHRNYLEEQRPMLNSLFRRIPFRPGNQRPFSSSAFSYFLGSLRAGRALRTFSLAATLGSTAYTVGAFYPPSLATYVTPRPAPPPLDPNLPESQAYIAALEEQLQNLPILLKHRAAEDREAWYETRPYKSFPEERRANNLTAGALRGPGLLALPPLVRARRDESEGFILVHVGRGLCGHDGIVHGGLLATLLDEGLARTVSCPRVFLHPRSNCRRLGYTESSRENRGNSQPLHQLPCADPRRPGNANIYLNTHNPRLIVSFSLLVHCHEDPPAGGQGPQGSCVRYYRGS